MAHINTANILQFSNLLFDKRSNVDPGTHRRAVVRRVNAVRLCWSIHRVLRGKIQRFGMYLSVLNDCSFPAMGGGVGESNNTQLPELDDTFPFLRAIRPLSSGLVYLPLVLSFLSQSVFNVYVKGSPWNGRGGHTPILPHWACSPPNFSWLRLCACVGVCLCVHTCLCQSVCMLGGGSV